MTDDGTAPIEPIAMAADGDLARDPKAVVRLVGAPMRAQNDERAVCRRYMPQEGSKPVSR